MYIWYEINYITIWLLSNRKHEINHIPPYSITGLSHGA